jgi:hypothetical protein
MFQSSTNYYIANIGRLNSLIFKVLILSIPNFGNYNSLLSSRQPKSLLGGKKAVDLHEILFLRFGRFETPGGDKKWKIWG